MGSISVQYLLCNCYILQECRYMFNGMCRFRKLEDFKDISPSKVCEKYSVFLEGI